MKWKRKGVRQLNLQRNVIKSVGNTKNVDSTMTFQFVIGVSNVENTTLKVSVAMESLYSDE